MVWGTYNFEACSRFPDGPRPKNVPPYGSQYMRPGMHAAKFIFNHCLYVTTNYLLKYCNVNPYMDGWTDGDEEDPQHLHWKKGSVACSC
jgi:hypothetical protein